MPQRLNRCDHVAALSGSPLERIVAAVRGQDPVPVDPGHLSGARRRGTNSHQVVIEQAKGAIMLRYGVNSHVAHGILSCWSRGLDIPLESIARALVRGVPGNSTPP